MQSRIAPHTSQRRIPHLLTRATSSTRRPERFGQTSKVELQLARKDVLDQRGDGRARSIGGRSVGDGGGARGEFGELWRWGEVSEGESVRGSKTHRQAMGSP